MSQSFTDSEEALLWQFERLFRFEFFLRNIQLDEDQKREYDKLKQLPDEIEKMAYHLLTSEYLYEVMFDIEDLITLVLNYLQFGDLPNLYNIGLNESDDLAKAIIDLCLHFKSNHDIKLKSKFYYFSTLVKANDIKEVIKWWNNISTPNSETRKKDNLVGRFGTIGKVNLKNIAEMLPWLEPIDDSDKGEEADLMWGEMIPRSIVENTKICHVSPLIVPFNIIFRPERNNYCIFQKTENTSSDDQESETYSLMLSVSLGEDASNLDLILDEFRQQFSLLQANYNWNLLQSGRIPTFQPPRGKEINQIIKEKRKANRIVTREESIDKNLIGLLCYDLYKSGKKLDTAAEEVATYSKNLGSKQFEIETIKKYYNSIRKHIKDIQRTLAQL